MSTIIESGLQLVARLSENCKRTLDKLDIELFPEGLAAKRTVEITGNPGGGKTLLLTQLIAVCILPTEINGYNVSGCDINVLLINTDHHFQVSKLVQIMQSILWKSLPAGVNLTEVELEKVMETSLKRLLIIDCCDNNQFLCNLYSLSEILSTREIGLVGLDGISAFYWQHRQTTDNKIIAINAYVSHILNRIQESTFQWNARIIYTKHSEFVTKGSSVSQCFENPCFGEVNYRINLLKETNSIKGVCKVESSRNSRTLGYETSDVGLKWFKL